MWLWLWRAQAKVMMRMLAYMTESIKDAFMVDELRDRTGEMLGYFLDHLVGKKSKDLKVGGRHYVIRVLE